jgi:hypothetical protein
LIGNLQIGAPFTSVFLGQIIDGGFNDEEDATVSRGGVLVVLYASDLNKKFEEVKQGRGRNIKAYI